MILFIYEKVEHSINNTDSGRKYEFVYAQPPTIPILQLETERWQLWSDHSLYFIQQGTTEALNLQDQLKTLPERLEKLQANDTVKNPLMEND